MTSDDFVTEIYKLATDNAVKDDELASALAGIIVALCKVRGEDPIGFMRWASDPAAEEVREAVVITIRKDGGVFFKINQGLLNWKGFAGLMVPYLYALSLTLNQPLDEVWAEVLRRREDQKPTAMWKH